MAKVLTSRRRTPRRQPRASGSPVRRKALTRERLLDAVVGRLLAELMLPVPGNAPWQDSFRALARDYRRLLLRHPNAIPLLATLQLSNPGALGAAGAVMALL